MARRRVPERKPENGIADTAHAEFEALTASVVATIARGRERAGTTTLCYKRAKKQFTAWFEETTGEDLGVEVPGMLLYAWALARKDDVKPGTLQRSVTNVVAGLERAGHTVTDVARVKDLVSKLAGAVRKSLDVHDRRAYTKQARAFTKEVLVTLLGKVADRRENPGGISDRWLLRFATSLYFAYVFALRISELLRAEWGWLEVGEQQLKEIDGETVIMRTVALTIPHSKWQSEPGTVTALVAADEWDQWVEQWRHSQEDAGAPTGNNERVFLETSKYRTLPYRDRVQRRSVAKKKLSDFPKVANELDDPGIDPTAIAAGSNRTVSWRCSVCGYRLTAMVKTRTGSGSGCRSCSNRRFHFEGCGSSVSAPEAGQDWIDLLADIEEGEEQAEAIERISAVYRKQLKRLCMAAGVTPRNDFEYIGSHGARRGRATDGFNGGANGVQVAGTLRHRKFSAVTLRYESEVDLSRPSPLHRLDGYVDAPET